MTNDEMKTAAERLHELQQAVIRESNSIAAVVRENDADDDTPPTALRHVAECLAAAEHSLNAASELLFDIAD